MKYLHTIDNLKISNNIYVLILNIYDTYLKIYINNLKISNNIYVICLKIYIDDLKISYNIYLKIYIVKYVVKKIIHLLKYQILKKFIMFINKINKFCY